MKKKLSFLFLSIFTILTTTAAVKYIANIDGNDSNTLSSWHKGDCFIYLDTLPSMLLKAEKPVTEVQKNLYHSTFILAENKYIKSIDGTEKVVLQWEHDGDMYCFNTNKTLQEINNSTYTPYLPIFIKESMLQTWKDSLINKVFYTKTTRWYDAENNSIKGQKYIPVTITAVVPYTLQNPLKIAFTTSNNQIGYFHINGVNEIRKNIIPFLSHNSYRDRYKQISDKNWELITHEQVILGMTKEEVQLSLGRPQESRIIPTHSSLIEDWLYNNGSYLRFTDGLLTQLRQ